jgi:hypothetical protein
MLLQCARSTPPGAGLTWVSFLRLLQVRQVKEKISQEKPDYGAERMKVIYSGM